MAVASEVTPEVPAHIDRFAAALKEAYGVAAEGMYTVVDPADANHDLTAPIKRMTDTWMSTAGYNASGQPMGYEGIFEEQMKLGALMATTAIVTWRKDTAWGRVAVETGDPRDVWLDHTSRGLYRIRRIEVDRHRLSAMAREKAGGKPLFNLPEIELQTNQWLSEMQADAEQLTGHGHEVLSTRKPMVLHEFYGDIIGPDGSVIAENALTMMSDEKHIIRGPEENPFWHNRDWVVYAPLVTVPLSPYGRGYAEDFGSVARTFNKLTNMILDAVMFSSIPNFAVIPGMLTDATQFNDGWVPGKMWQIQDGMGAAKDFMTAIQGAGVTTDTVRVWESVKSMLTEAARMNEVGLGQFAPNSRTSATEITETQQSSSALIRSVAQTIEQRHLEPTLNLGMENRPPARFAQRPSPARRGRP